MEVPMKILVLIGSYRRNGNTDQLAGLIRDGLQKEAEIHLQNLEIETIYLGHQQINPCRGCRICFERGEDKCPLKDDLLPVKAKMKQADGILVASPIYVDDVSGITKTWIDRLAHVCHRPEFAGKCAYLVTTVGSSPSSHSLRTLNLALSTWGFHIIGQEGFKTGALMQPEETRSRFQERAERIAHRLFKALYDRQFTRPSFMSLMMFRIQQLAWQRADPKKSPYDYQYWENTGWLDPKREFYISTRASRIKIALARLTGSVIFPFVA
jgi:multimeric flavodoxin WrbA